MPSPIWYKKFAKEQSENIELKKNTATYFAEMKQTNILIDQYIELKIKNPSTYYITTWTFRQERKIRTSTRGYSRTTHLLRRLPVHSYNDGQKIRLA